MSLDMEVGRGPGDVVISAHVYVAKRPDGSRYYLVRRYRPRPRPHYVRWEWGLAPPPEKGGYSPLFSAHVYCGQTVAHLSYC